MDTNAASTHDASPDKEEDLRQQLESALQALKQREPLEPTYKKLLMNGVVTPRRPVLAKGKIIKKIGSRLRERVELFCQANQGKDPMDRLLQRQPIEDDKLRAAFTLREAKAHEQDLLLETTLAAMPRRKGMDEKTRRRYLEGVALGLQSPTVSSAGPANNRNAPVKEPKMTAAEQTKRATQQALEEARRNKKEEQMKQNQQQEIQRKRKAPETPQRALHNIIEPIFQKLWDMEFAHLGSTNPFRIIIDRDNCASVGAPDYFDYITQPMNLTYIQQKVQGNQYESLATFCADVELMITNALTYNSDPSNPYRVAAEDLQSKYKKMVARVRKALQQKQQQQQARKQS
jgi:Bromodomain